MGSSRRQGPAESQGDRCGEHDCGDDITEDRRTEEGRRLGRYRLPPTGTEGMNGTCGGLEDRWGRLPAGCETAQLQARVSNQLCSREGRRDEDLALV
jgi:hypothetical protein